GLLGREVDTGDVLGLTGGITPLPPLLIHLGLAGQAEPALAIPLMDRAVLDDQPGGENQADEALQRVLLEGIEAARRNRRLQGRLTLASVGAVEVGENIYAALGRFSGWLRLRCRPKPYLGHGSRHLRRATPERSRPRYRPVQGIAPAIER